jgi:hypothetical protein
VGKKEWDNALLMLKSVCDFGAYPIVSPVDSASTMFVRQPKPVAADDHDLKIAGSQSRLNLLCPFLAEPDVFGVHEDS